VRAGHGVLVEALAGRGLAAGFLYAFDALGLSIEAQDKSKSWSMAKD
jgi:hypothetical protein